jgi:hypothetical protein
MKYLIFSIAVLLFGIALWRFYKSKVGPSGAPTISSLTTVRFSDSLIDVGTNKYKVPVKANFVVYNTGTNDLYISSVVPDCHCTVASFSKDPIHPVDSSIITLKYDASNLGPFQSSAMVTTNSATPTTLLIFRGIIAQ